MVDFALFHLWLAGHIVIFKWPSEASKTNADLQVAWPFIVLNPFLALDSQDQCNQNGLQGTKTTMLSNVGGFFFKIINLVGKGMV